MKRGDELDYLGRKRSKYWSVNDDPSMTVQSDAHLADIQNILAQYGAGGMQSLDEAALEFRDISEFTDYHDLMLNVREAEVRFMELPSKVREIFDHSVEKWLDTAHDEDKRDALVAAGFIKDEKSAVQGGGAGGGADITQEGASTPTPAGPAMGTQAAAE